MNASCFLGEPLDEGSAVADLGSRFPEWLSLLQCHQQGEILHGLENQVMPAFEESRSIRRGPAAPRTEGVRCSRDRLVVFLAATIGHAAKNLACGGVRNLDRSAFFGGDPLAADKTSVSEQRRIAKRHDFLHGRLRELTVGLAAARSATASY